MTMQATTLEAGSRDRIRRTARVRAGGGTTFTIVLGLDGVSAGRDNMELVA
jgi:hypothetical protein